LLDLPCDHAVDGVWSGKAVVAIDCDPFDYSNVTLGIPTANLLRRWRRLAVSTDFYCAGMGVTGRGNLCVSSDPQSTGK
jgi:hypothetical protein